MTSNFSRPGAVDLSGLAKPPAAPGVGPGQGPATGAGDPAGAAGGSALGPYVLDVTEQSFESDVVNRSLSVPVVLVFWAAQIPPSVQLVELLDRLATEYEGRFVVGRVDVATQRELAASVGVQQLPLVLAILRGQALPLFDSPLPEDQVRQVLDQLLTVAVQQGVAGRSEPLRAAAVAEGADALAEPPHDPRYDEAYDAIDRGDLDAAAAAYRKLLSDAPADSEAKAGLAQVGLLQRTEGLDPASVRAAATDDPADVAAQLQAADLDIVQGQVEDAFERLVRTVAVTAGAERDRVRTHLLELFEVVGAADPRVGTARAALARVLF